MEIEEGKWYREVVNGRWWCPLSFIKVKTIITNSNSDYTTILFEAGGACVGKNLRKYPGNWGITNAKQLLRLATQEELNIFLPEGHPDKSVKEISEIIKEVLG